MSQRQITNTTSTGQFVSYENETYVIMRANGTARDWVGNSLSTGTIVLLPGETVYLFTTIEEFNQFLVDHDIDISQK